MKKNILIPTLISIFISFLVIFLYFYNSNSIQTNEFKGDLLWVNSFYEGSDKFLHDIKINTKNEIFAVGTNENENEDFLLVKYNQDGIMLWNQSYNLGGFDYATSIDFDSKDNIYINGQSKSLSKYDYVFLKLDPNGNIIWNITPSIENIYTSVGVKVNSNDEAIFLTMIKKGANSDYLIKKYDSLGNELFSKIFEPNFYSLGIDLTLDKNNNIYFTGFNNSGILISKFDNFGQNLWFEFYNQKDKKIRIYSLEIIGDYIYLTGTSDQDLLLLKYDLLGNLVFSKEYGGEGFNMGRDITYFDENNIYISGDSNGDFLLMRINSSGDVLNNITFDGYGEGDSSYGIVVDSRNNPILTGHSKKNLTAHAFTIKYD